MSTTITTEQIKELRDQTGVSVMQCKKALEEANGDKEQALLILKKKSSDVASKKADRETNDGLIIIKTAPSKAVAVVLLCETDFVAKNSDFTELADVLANKALADGKDATLTASNDLIGPVIQKIGENIKLESIDTFDGGVVGSYVHNGKAGVVVVLEGGDEVLAKDIAMHIAAMKPEYSTQAEVTEETKQKLKELFTKEVDESGKPEDIKAKMLEGKISSFLKERVLTEQSFIKNPEMTIAKLLESKGAKLVTFKHYTI